MKGQERKKIEKLLNRFQKEMKMVKNLIIYLN